MSKKRSNSFHKPALGSHGLKKSDQHVGKKKPLQAIMDATHPNITRQKSIPKAHKDLHKDPTNKKSNKKLDPSPKKRKHPSPKKESSGKKHHKSKQYDSPSKQHEDVEYFVISRSHKNTKRDKKNSHEIQSILNAVKDRLKKNKASEAIHLLVEARNKDQNNYDINYLLGVCYLVNGQYPNGVAAFKHLLTNSKPKKDVYLMLSVCFKKLEDYASAEGILNACIEKYPKYYEAYVYRGKLYVKLKKFRDANGDFEQAIHLYPNRQIGYIGKGDCLRSSENYQQAIELYNAALELEPNNSILLRRAICYLQLERWDPAMSDIEKLLEVDPESSEVLYFKGLVYTKKKNYNEAIICYQQAIKYDANKKAVARSIYEIAKIKIEQRDYYEAFYTLSRTQYLDVEIKSLQKLKTFTDGVTSLMKKNYEKGIETLNELQKEHNLTRFLKPLFYSSRAYGLMCLEMFEEARADFIRLEKEVSLDSANLYNKFICEGILSCRNEKYEQSLAYFSKAEKVLSKRLEPNFYKAATLIKFSNKLIPKNLIEKKKEYLSSALKTVQKCQKITENNPNLLLIRGLLHLSLGSAHDALKDLEASIEDSIAPKAINFYLKAISLASTHRFSDAINELTTAAHHDEKYHEYPEIYLNRARCHMLIGEANQAFNDLQVYMSHRSTSPDIHIWAGHALFYVGAYEDAAKTYSNVNNILKNTKVLLDRAKCYLSAKNMVAAQQDFRTILGLEENFHVLFDSRMMEIFTLCQEKEQDLGELVSRMKKFKREHKCFGNIFHKVDYYFYKAVLYSHVPNYDKAIKNFQKAQEIKEREFSIEAIMEEDNSRVSHTKGTFSSAELSFNLAVCCSLNGNIPKAIKFLESTKQEVDRDKKMAQSIETFISSLQTEKKLMFAPPKKGMVEEEVSDIFPFPHENRLCSVFPELVIPLTKSRLRTRLFFCLPEVRKPDIVPQLDEKALEAVDTSWIETRPQAPWIKRNDQNVIFTDQVVWYEVQISESNEQDSEAGQQQDHQERFEQREEDREEEGEESMDQHQQGMYMHENSEGESPEKDAVTPPNPRDFARMMKLDVETEARLARLFQK